MKISILICSFGDDSWRRLAAERALPSALGQGAEEVRHWHSPDLSLAETRNAAAREAAGTHLLFLDADDALGDGFLLAMRETAAQRVQDGRALLFPAVSYVQDGEESEPTILGGGRPLIEINRAVIGSLVPRDVFLEVGGFRDLPALEDWDLWLRVSELVPLLPVPEAVYRVFVRPRSRNADQRLYWKLRREHEARTA